MKKIKYGIKRINDFFHTISVLILIFIALYIFLDILMRYFKLKPIGDVVELTGYLNVWMSLLAMSVLFREKHHIHVDIITSRLKPKSRLKLEKVTDIIVAVYSSIMLFRGITTVVSSYKMGQSSMSWHFKIWPFQIAVPLGFLLLFLEILVNFKKQQSNEIK